MNNLGQLNNGIKSEFGHLNSQFAACLKNVETKGLLSYTLKENKFLRFKNGGFAEKCSVLGDAVSSEYFNEGHKLELFASCPSLTQRCIADNTQLASLLKAAGLLSTLGSKPANLGNDTNLTALASLNLSNEAKHSQDASQEWSLLITQVQTLIQCLEWDDIKPLCLQVLKFLQEVAIPEKERYLASLVFCHLVVKDYPSFGFQSSESAKDFGVYFIKVLKPNLADYINWEMIDKSINLSKVIKFSQAYQNYFNPTNQDSLMETMQRIMNEKVEAALLPLSTSIDNLSFSPSKIQENAQQVQLINQKINTLNEAINRTSSKIDNFMACREVSVLTNSLTREFPDWPPILNDNVYNDFTNFVQQKLCGPYRIHCKLSQLFYEYNTNKAGWPQLKEAFSEVIRCDHRNKKLMEKYWANKCSDTSYPSWERSAFCTWSMEIDKL